MAKGKDWFAAHKEGLRQIAERLVERRGFGIIGGELYQNVMDTAATLCNIWIKLMPGGRTAELIVEDNDPTGFKDLTHAWTVFAPSEKKGDPTKAGRFNMGEKTALSFCREAQIATTIGTVAFNDKGRESFPRRKREVGTRFWAIIDCNQKRLDEFLAYMKRIIVRPGLKLVVNGELIPHRSPVKTFVAALKTEKGEDLRPTTRKTDVLVFEPLDNDEPMLYELGIPVVALPEHNWDICVMQKVPLNVDRDNVTPAYLRDINALVFNETYEELSPEDTTRPWVTEATSDKRVEPEAFKDFMTKKHGNRYMALDPFNQEANQLGFGQGYKGLGSHDLTPGQRENAKRDDLLRSSTQLFGAPRGAVQKVLSEKELTPGMKLIRQYTEWLGRELLGEPIEVEFVEQNAGSTGYITRASYGDNRFRYNVQALGKEWFANGVTMDVDELVLHELGHHMESNHFSSGYHRALCHLGAKLKRLAIDHASTMTITYKQKD